MWKERRKMVKRLRYVKEREGSWCRDEVKRLVLAGNERISTEELKRCVALLTEEYPFSANLPEVLLELGSEAESLAEAVRPGDLVISGDSCPELSEVPGWQEGYVLDMGETLYLRAQSYRSVFYGLRTLLESETLSCGIAVDYPETKERGLHLDMGRKYFTCDWLLKLLREMSQDRMNLLELHFSENEGFRLACDSHPEVPSGKHLTKEEFQKVVNLAGDYGIALAPSLDCPGHLRQALMTHPEWQLPDKDGGRLDSALDITNADARAFVLELMDEYAGLFAGAPYFHVGGDEFIDFRDFSQYPELERYAKEKWGPEATGADTYVDYLNEVIRHVKAKGFSVRVWNDGLYRLDVVQHQELEPDTQIAYWTNWDPNMASIQPFLDRGFPMINYNGDYLYYILLEREDYTDPTAEEIYAEWTPNVFPRNKGKAQAMPEERLPELTGACYSIWCDWPEFQTEEELAEKSRESRRAMGERCWRWKAEI